MGVESGKNGLATYYRGAIEQIDVNLREKTKNLRRLEAQRNELNAKVRALKEELQLLQEPGSYVGEVVKVMGKTKVLVKVHPEGKYVVDVDKGIDLTKLTPSTRVALRNDSYVLHLVLPSKVDPLVSLMRVEKVPDSTYDMIGGLDQQIKEIKEVIELPIKHPELFESLGIAQPKGVLLYGPPGTGKTLLARAVAHHTDCTFIRVSGSELVQKYIGEGSRMVRELFVMAREHAPSIIFMDEIDSIGSARMESGSGNGDSEVQRTMLELLNQLDGFEASNQIKVLMATNRIDILDPALLRPGRIDRKIEFPNPSEESRVDILKIHSRKMNLMRGIDLSKIAGKMNGASGAELKLSAFYLPSQLRRAAMALACSMSSAASTLKLSLAPPRTASTTRRCTIICQAEPIRRPGPVAPQSADAPAAAAPASPASSAAATVPAGVTVEYQRQAAKEMVAYFQEKKYEQDVRDGKVLGFTTKNEIGNGRWAMFGLAVGLLTEYATGVNFPDQLYILLSNFGIVD
ncbi:unnamed protein product [Closterium sp. NIES-65]|nr:unnamed protein product [Closterium sp. NIES-65]CAI6006883.1 unnamed protein product [Closterium sp. NIES-65]